MQTLIIGDIHGCYTELQSLLDKAGLSDGDQVITTGDFMDRGPETPQVVDFIRRTPNVRTLVGNHEYKHMRAMRGEVKLATSQRISQSQLGDAYADAVAWMNTLPFYLELPEADLFHGYLEPGLPLAEQRLAVLTGTLGGELYLHHRYDKEWYELYDRPKPAIVGHHNYTDSDQPFVYRDRVFGLDTSCVKGKALTGILLPSFRFISVPSRGHLWRAVREDYDHQQRKAAAPRDIPWSREDLQALERLVTRVIDENARLVARFESIPEYGQMTDRQRVKLYKFEVGDGFYGKLMHIARVGKLAPDLARRVLRDPKVVWDLLTD